MISMFYCLLEGKLYDSPDIKDNETFVIPDSPFSYSFNTWDDNKWTEIDVNNKSIVKEWSIEYTWLTDGFPEEASFYVLSPSGTKVNIASEEIDGAYNITLNSFLGESANGKWRLWIEDSYGDGGVGQKFLPCQLFQWNHTYL
jgi:hypothetical protein